MGKINRPRLVALLRPLALTPTSQAWRQPSGMVALVQDLVVRQEQIQARSHLVRAVVEAAPHLTAQLIRPQDQAALV